MKKHTTKTTALLTSGLFFAIANAFAQVSPPTPAQAAGSGYLAGNNTTLAVPKASGPNFFLEGGLAYMNAKTGLDQDNRDYWGPSIAFGWRIDKNNKIQVETLALFSSESFYGSYGGYTAKITQDIVAVPVLFSYAYCIPLGSSNQWELSLYPTVGYYTAMMKLKGSLSGISGSASDDDTDSSFAFGGRVGLTYHINKHVYLDVSYRYLRAGSSDYELFGEYFKQDAFNANSATISLGWKF